MTTNNNKRQLSARLLAAALTICLYGCSGEITDGNTLPAGKYPMTFTAAVDGLMQTRATTTGGTTSWQENDLVAICMDGGTNHKQYKITDASIGAMSPNDEANTLYWSKTQETLAAWYPVSCTIGRSKVNITDQSSGFGTLENILHAPAKGYTFSSGGAVAFTFRHALAKVKVTLQKGEGITDSDLSGATVRLMGYTAGSLGYDGMTGSDSNGEITPHTETPAGGGSSIPATYTALLIPQQMQNQKFIKITVGTDGAARDYYYTPTGTNDANLEAGNQYTYTITVKKTGLEVQVTGNGVSWDDVPITSTPAESITYQITAPTSAGITITAGDGCTLEDSGGSYTLSGGNAITVTVDAGGNSDKFLKGIPVKGIYDIKSISFTDGSYIYTYTLKGDISFSAPSFSDKTTPAPGDYYYSDGTWSAELWEKPCIGIVFKAGAGNNDVLNDYDNKLSGQINGYAVALQDAARFGIMWSTVQENCQTSTTTNDYKGYDNTAKVLCVTDYSPEKYPVFQAVSEFGETTVAPSGSSGWYLPSAGQMIDIVNSWGNNGIITQKLNLLPYDYAWKIPTTSHGYATSTEYPNSQAKHVCRIAPSGNIQQEQKDYS